MHTPLSIIDYHAPPRSEILRNGDGMPTLRDIAKRANVSISTVSKALNNSHEISGHTAARVVKAARELHYISLEDDTGGISQAARTIGAVRDPGSRPGGPRGSVHRQP